MRGLYVILVDDDELMLRMLEPALAAMRTTPAVSAVVTASGPERALRLLADAPEGPLAIVTDFNLKAAQNGLDILRWAQKQRPASVRILISGYAAEQIGDVTAGGAAHAFVEKPLRLRDLIEEIERALARHAVV
ncbi:MAG TPA: response regulator [Candidatus Thermoplasmatota archaeon]|nr:response regulator [Candidatus Thermoplasmatota archaeon]